MTPKPKGQLIIIGGHEREGELDILKEVVKTANRHSGNVLVVTVATHEPEALAKEYTKLFKDLGAKKVNVLDVRQRSDAQDEANVKQCQAAGVIFFTGGDQLRITSQVGDSPLFQCMREMYINGITIAGTSAGAAAMPETMIVYGEGDSSQNISALGMAPGLGLIEGLTIDTHFAERGRIGRILGAVAQNPRNLGIGIDEDTAICVKHDGFKVMGAGAVYVVDGSELTYSSLSEGRPEGVVSIYDMKLHVLAADDRFDLLARRPLLSQQAKNETA
jgi:cyanophycinase